MKLLSDKRKNPLIFPNDGPVAAQFDCFEASWEGVAYEARKFPSSIQLAKHPA